MSLLRRLLRGLPVLDETERNLAGALGVALIVGGSIVIPHLRRAFARMREIPNLGA